MRREKGKREKEKKKIEVHNDKKKKVGGRGGYGLAEEKL
jgi:hypothetical protein